MQMPLRCKKCPPPRRRPDRASLVVRASENSLNRDHTFPENFSLAIDVGQEHVKGPNTLLEPAHNLAPFAGRENLWQQIAKPGVVVFAGREFESDSKFSKCCVQPFFKFPQISGCRTRQLSDKIPVRCSRFSLPRSLSTSCHRFGG